MSKQSLRHWDYWRKLNAFPPKKYLRALKLWAAIFGVRIVGFKITEAYKGLALEKI